MLEVDIVQPKSLNELWKTVSQIKEPHRYLAGGTDLVVVAKHGIGTPCTWIDISKIKELKKIEEKKDSIFIGALVTYAEISESNLIKKWVPALGAVCPEFASPPIRSLATVGGNCANASPAGDGLPALYVEGAKVILKLKKSAREVPIEKFFLGPRKTVLKKNELVVGLKIPKKSGFRGTFLKVGPRKGLAIAKASLALSLKLNGSGTIQDLKIALGAVGPTVIRAQKTESILCGQKIDSSIIKKAKELVQTECSPITDHRSTAEYRKAMCGVLLGRALERLLKC